MTKTTTVATSEDAQRLYDSGPEGHQSVIAQAQAEAKAIKAALAAGEDRPATPALDYINSRPKGAKATKAAVRGNAAAARLVRLTRNGKPLDDRYNTLGWLAQRVGLSLAQLLAYLKAAGVEDPNGTTWEVRLVDVGRGGTVGATAISGAVSIPAAKVRLASSGPASSAASARKRAAGTKTTTKAEPATPGKAEPVPATRKAPAKKAPAKRAAKATKVA